MHVCVKALCVLECGCVCVCAVLLILEHSGSVQGPVCLDVCKYVCLCSSTAA